MISKQESMEKPYDIVVHESTLEKIQEYQHGRNV